MTDTLEFRALREAREVCPANMRHTLFGDDVIPPAECECCRRIAAALLRAEARGCVSGEPPRIGRDMADIHPDEDRWHAEHEAAEKRRRAEHTALLAVADAAREYIDYLAAGKLEPYGGDIRRGRIHLALADLDRARKGDADAG